MNKYIINVTILLVVIGLFIYFIHKFDTSYKSKVIIDKVELSVLKQHQIDSTNTARYNERDSMLEAQANVFTIKYNALLLEVAKAKKKDKEVMQKYNDNPEIQTEICNEIIEAKDNTIGKLDKIILVRDSTIAVKDTAIYEGKLLISSKDTTIQNLSINNSILIDNAKKNNTWIKRNEKWGYLGLGILVGRLVLN